MTEVDDFLAHYGVKGMKWGKTTSKSSDTPTRREARKALKAPNPNYKKQTRRVDAALVGRAGVKSVNKRMNKGETHKSALNSVAKRQIIVGLSVAAAGLALPHVANMGVKAAANSPQRVRGQKAIGTGYTTIKLKQNRDGSWG